MRKPQSAKASSTSAKPAWASRHETAVRLATGFSTVTVGSRRRVLGAFARNNFRSTSTTLSGVGDLLGVHFLAHEQDDSPSQHVIVAAIVAQTAAEQSPKRDATWGHCISSPKNNATMKRMPILLGAAVSVTDKKVKSPLGWLEAGTHSKRRLVPTFKR
jgi:hypothetical protein